MSDIKLKFTKQAIGENDFEIIAEIVGSTSDLRKNWAVLGMRYAKSISEKVTFDALNHVEDKGAEITFLNADYFYELDSDDFCAEFDDLCPCNMTDKELEMTIGLELNVFDSYNRIGGLMTPSVLMARIVFSELEKKRQTVKL